MLSTTVWLRTWFYFGCISGWTTAARPQFDTSTNMGLVLVPADAEVDSVIFRLRATDQDADFPLIFDITAAVQPIVKIANLPCTLWNKVCQANVVLTRRLVPGRLHDFAVRVRDSKGDTNSMQATISVTNATTPRDMIFPHVPSIIMVPEDTKPGKELDYLLVRANPWHGKPVYIELWQPKELFTIRQRQTPTQTRGVITLVGELDFETQSMYTLTMYATDPYTEAGKDTRNIAGVHVVVVVQDVQDVPPVFTLAPPLTRVNNSVKPGDVILRVHAEDGDKGTPREVTYGLVSEGNPFTPFFNISEPTGEIILARPLEELTQITHVGAPILLTVVAEEVRRSRDEPPGQATVVELGLLLGEPGNSPPYFESDSYVAWMEENAAPGTVVMFDNPDLAVIKDEDIGKTGVFALKLGNNNGTFEVAPAVAERVANFVVTVRNNTLMDFEARKTLEFMVTAQEVGPATNLSTSVPVTVFLKDVNDNPPEFEKETYEVTIAENVPPGTRVVQVHATDRDTGLSGNVRYTGIIGPGSETLTMDSETGLIVVAEGSTGLDREETPSLRLSVEARDENGRGLRKAVPLIVNLIDVNDNAPIFEKPVYEFILNSEQTNFTSPAFIRAVDADAEPPNNEVRYELVHGNYGNKFYLNEVTGELILREPLNKSRRRRNNPYVNFATRFRSDFLQTLNTFRKIGVSTDEPLRIWKNRKKRAMADALYTLTVRAYDSGVPHLSSTAKVNVVTAAPVGGLTLMLVVPAEHLDPVQTTETLAAITGGRVTIQEIKPYDQPGRPGEGNPQGGKMSIVVAKVEPTMSGTFLVDVDTIHKSLVANGMGIVPVVNSNTNLVSESPVGAVDSKPVGNGNIGSPTGGIPSVISIDRSSDDEPSESPKPMEGNSNGGTSGGNQGTPGNTGVQNPGGVNVGDSDGRTSVAPSDDSGKETPGKGSVGGNTLGGTSTGTGGDTASSSNGAAAGGTDESIAGTRTESNGVGTIGGVPNAGNGVIPGVVVSGSNDQTGVNSHTVINKTTSSSSESEYIVYKAENKLLLWLLILLGLLMLLGLLALILCCICPGCPFYMAPRKRRVHSFDSVNHPEGRPKRHLRRKQLNPVKAEWSGKKQAWSADPTRRNWQFNRRNTKNRGLASLPGDVAQIKTLQAQPGEPSLRLRDGPEFWGVHYPAQKHRDDRIYVEDVEAARNFDVEDIDSLRRHEMERGSDVLRQGYPQTETSRLPREQHFFRDGNAEVLRLVTGGHVDPDEMSLQAQRPTTLVGERQILTYRNDGKDILLRRFMEDQKIRQHQDLRGSGQGNSADGSEPVGGRGEDFSQKHEVIIIPGNLELEERHRREEEAPRVQRLVIDHGDEDAEELTIRNGHVEAQEAEMQRQRKIAAAMLVGTAVSRATEKPTTKTRNPSSMKVPAYAIHDMELAKQNALLTQLLMDRDSRHLGVPGLDPGSYLETQSLPGQVAIATQTDRTAATQTENRSRSDNEESEEEVRSRRKSKSKKRLTGELRRSRSLWTSSPIQEESRSFSETRTHLLRRRAKEAREGRKATLEPEVLREISDSLDEQASTPSLEEEQLRTTENPEYQGDVDEGKPELEEIPTSSSPDVNRDKYHRRSHARAVIGEASQTQNTEVDDRKQSSPARSRTGQKTETKDRKKESEVTSTDAQSSAKKPSTESQSNNDGTENEDTKRTRTKSKLLSKTVLIKSSSEKPSKREKSRDTEEVTLTKKRTMLRHQKAKKTSTESSELEEITPKPKHLSSKPKAPKPIVSTSGSEPRTDSAKGKEINTLSDETKSRSSVTDSERLTKRVQKRSDSTSSSAKPGIEDKKKLVEDAKKVEGSKVEQSIGQDLKDDDSQVGTKSLKPEAVSAEREGLLPRLESEIVKLSKVMTGDRLNSSTNDEEKRSLETAKKSEEASAEIKSELPILIVKEKAETGSKNLQKIDEKVLDKLEDSQALEFKNNGSVIQKKSETSSTGVLDTNARIPDNLEAVVPMDPKNGQEIPIVEQNPEMRTKEGSEVIPEEEKKVNLDSSGSSNTFLPVEDRPEPESSITETTLIDGKIQDKPEELQQESGSQGTEADASTVSKEKQLLLNAKEVTEAFLQSEAMQSSYDQQVTLRQEKDHLVVKGLTPNPGDVGQKEIPKEDNSEVKNGVTENIGDPKTGSTEVPVISVDARDPEGRDTEDMETQVEGSQEKHDSFTVIGQPGDNRDTTSPRNSHPREEKHSPVKKSKIESPGDIENGNPDPPEIKLPAAREGGKEANAEIPPLDKDIVKKDVDRKSPEKKPGPASEEENFPPTGSPSFYILSSGSSAEDFPPPGQGTLDAQINLDEPSPTKAVTLVSDVSNLSKAPALAVLTEQKSDRRSQARPEEPGEMRPGEWDTGQIQIGELSSDSPDNAQPYQTPRHRSRNRIGNGDEVASKLLRGDKEQDALSRSDGVPESKAFGIPTTNIEDHDLTPKIIAEEAIRRGLREIIDSDAMKRDSSSQTSSKTSPENRKPQGETTKRKPIKEAQRTPSIVERKKKTTNGKKFEGTQEPGGSTRPKTEPKGGNPREGDAHQVRPRTQRGKESDSGIRRWKPSERTQKVKQNVDELKTQEVSQLKGDDLAPSKEGYMSRYKQKREEMERRRRELKEASEEKRRPRWQRKPVVIPVPRVPGKETTETPEGKTPRIKRRVKPLINAESEQLRAMVKEGRKLRRTEGGDSDDPTVEIFAPEPPGNKTSSFHEPSHNKYEKIQTPFYLHPPPPPPPQSTPQISPLHAPPSDLRRPDDDLDSGIAGSLQGGTKLRHQQLLEKKSVFDIAYSEAAPSQLRTDSTTPPS